ncbi:hypothetical protein C2G38_2230180 [Gigaspora rosea]|uniref:Uncharacterized protein n=1 Tax=Gigaspora rosea TaxID=44941 RepID=A0A397TXQ1_9GLOM|nr:hypothetical protein C2G38_2230180 [Gigaspora rosea]
MDNNIVRQQTSLPQCQAYDNCELLVSYTINCYVKLAFNLSQGTDIENIIKGISGTSKKKFLLPGNSSWKLKKFFPAQLSKLQKTEITRPHPQFSDYSIPETDWLIPLPYISNHSNSILLPAGWALKETQKFGIKEKDKRISKNVVPLLEAFFLAGDANKSDRYTAENMLNELHSMAREGLLEDDEIPKLTIISNWISGYAKKYQQDLAKQSIEISEAC